MTSLWLIEGCPGGGKTRELARQAQRAAAVHGPSSVAICSLTKTAASEIGTRVLDLPDEATGTLHAHCYRALDRPDLAETPEGLRDWGDHHPATPLAGGRGDVDNAPVDETGGRSHTDEIHAQVQAHRARRTPADQWTVEQRDHHQTWTDWKTQTGRLDFTDLIERALHDVDEHPAMPEVLLGDECQDFSALELDLFARWAKRTRTSVLVGDLSQALYTWRGASPDTLRNLPLAGRRTLDQSWRVPRTVHTVANSWAGQLPAHRAGYRPTDTPGQARELDVSLRYPDPLIAEIESDLHARRGVMVLTACGYMLGGVIRALRDAGVPFHNPHRATQGAWNPLRGAGRLAAFLRPSDRCWADQARRWTWRDLRDWTEPLAASQALAHGAKALIERKTTPDRFGRTRADQEVPLDVLLELLGTTDLQHPALQLDVTWWADRLRAAKRAAMSYPLEVLHRRGPAALHQRPQVTVGTVHSVKGGEASSVYLAPDLSLAGADAWERGGPSRDAIVRLGYVGLTRTRDRLTVLEPAGSEYMPLHEHLGAERTAVAA